MPGSGPGMTNHMNRRQRNPEIAAFAYTCDHQPFPFAIMKSKSQPSSACVIVWLKRYA